MKHFRRLSIIMATSAANLNSVLGPLNEKQMREYIRTSRDSSPPRGDSDDDEDNS